MAPSTPSGDQPRRKSVRVKSARGQAKAIEGNSQQVRQPPSDHKHGRGRKKRKVVEASPLDEVTDAAGGDESELDELPSRASRGSLSQLLDMPLDILLEIFTHVTPGDLLNVARVNKSFSGLLLSRRSISLWRATFDAVGPENYPPKPDDWTELAWVQLVSGSKTCSDCGSRTTLDVLWTFRKRLCRGCKTKRLIDTAWDRNWHKLADRSKDLRKILPSLPSRSGAQSGHHCNNPYVLHSDVAAYHQELEKLPPADENEALFLLKREELYARMLRRTRKVMKHARLCERAAERLKEGQVANKEERTILRVTQIYERLILHGFGPADLEEPFIRDHKDVNNPRTLTKEVWERLKPTFIDLAEKARQIRLEREKVERRTAREKAVAIEYRSFLGRVEPKTTSLMPTMDELLHLPLVSAAIAEDQEATDELHCTVAEALKGSLSQLTGWITSRAEALRTAVPESWPVANLSSSSTLSAKRAPLHDLDLYPSLADLDLAVYTFTCGRILPESPYNYCDVQKLASEVHYGLDSLAHPCLLSNLTEFRCVPLPSHHRAVLRILEMLQLDPASTTVDMLDALNPVFVDPSRSQAHWAQPSSQGHQLMTWRQTVSFFCDFKAGKTSRIRLLTLQEREWLDAKMINEGGLLATLSDGNHYSLPAECLPVWGCLHCLVHLGPNPRDPISHHPYDAGWSTYKKLCASQPDDPWRWLTIPELYSHLAEAHDVTAPVEGKDFHFNRHISRRIHTGFPMLPVDISSRATLQIA
ncbi:unnamed protein product [Peniophora sp. CBMAI 1063]|nr:unnamed protein product [Peniophora sp. CBMAI 1063]